MVVEFERTFDNAADDYEISRPISIRTVELYCILYNGFRVGSKTIKFYGM